MNKNIEICNRDNSCRIAAFTYFAACILKKHGFVCDESYENSGLIVRYVNADKGWIVAVTASYMHVGIENHTEGGIPTAYQEEFVKDLMQDGLFEPSSLGPLDADFESPLEEVWRRIAPHLSNEDIISIFTSHAVGIERNIIQPKPKYVNASSAKSQK